MARSLVLSIEDLANIAEALNKFSAIAADTGVILASHSGLYVKNGDDDETELAVTWNADRSEYQIDDWAGN